MSVLIHIKQQLSSLSKAETAVASIILRQPETIVDMTTAELAAMAGVSGPMISRLCKSLGYKSFPAFKVALAQSLASGHSYISQTVCVDDSTETFIEKRINANSLALEYLRQSLDPNKVEQAINYLSHAKHILIFGMGGTASVAHDAQHKLFRLGIPTTVHTDHIMQHMAAANANPDTVVVVFSFTGRTKTMVEIAQIAAANGAEIIAMTSPNSPLAKVAQLTINSGHELEDTTVYVPMTTRLVLLTIIDILVTGLALALGPDIEAHLERIKHSIDNTKLPQS